MNNRIIVNILRFIGLLLLQVMVIDNIRLGYYVHPCVYVLFILMLPFNIEKWQLLCIAFFLGLAVDLFNGTPGLNAASTVLMAFLRPFVITSMTRRKDVNESDSPSLNMGISWFLIYTLLLVTTHNFSLFLLEAFSFQLLYNVLFQTLLSVISSILLIFTLLLLFKKSNKKLI